MNVDKVRSVNVKNCVKSINLVFDGIESGIKIQEHTSGQVGSKYNPITYHSMRGVCFTGEHENLIKHYKVIEAEFENNDNKPLTLFGISHLDTNPNSSS